MYEDYTRRKEEKAMRDTQARIEEIYTRVPPSSQTQETTRYKTPKTRREEA
jgi:hypothetical protein